MKGFCINAPAVKKSQDNLSVGVIFSGIMFPSKGMKLEEDMKVFPVLADEDVLRNVSRKGFRRPRIPQPLQPKMDVMHPCNAS